jgi:hypothetical protein
MGRKWRSKMKTMKKMMTLLAVVGLVLALAPAAQANAVWTGNGDGVIWSDMVNWQDGLGGWGPTGTDEDPTTGVNLAMNGSGSTTVHTNTTLWGIADLTLSVATDTINIGPGATLKTTGKFRNGTTIQTGGTVNHGSLQDGNPGTTQISGGSYFAKDWRNNNISDPTVLLHITGSAATSIQINNFLTTVYSGKDLPEISYTLDASGVTPLKVSEMGNVGQLDKLTINVDGIENYTGTDPIPLFIDINSAINNPGVIVAGTIPDDSFLSFGKTLTNDDDTLFWNPPPPPAGTVIIIK